MPCSGVDYGQYGPYDCPIYKYPKRNDRSAGGVCDLLWMGGVSRRGCFLVSVWYFKPSANAG